MPFPLNRHSPRPIRAGVSQECKYAPRTGPERGDVRVLLRASRMGDTGCVSLTELERLHQEWRDAAVACERVSGRKGLRGARAKVKVAARAYGAYRDLVEGLVREGMGRRPRGR